MFSPMINPPMYVVTCTYRDERSGCLVGFGTQCSIQPPRFLACLSVENHTFKVAENASALAVHLLTENDRSLASLFGEQTGDKVDKFTKVPWHIGKTGAPILDDCDMYFEGMILEKVPFGDHVGFVLSPVDEGHNSEASEETQLTLHDVEDFSPGHPINK